MKRILYTLLGMMLSVGAWAQTNVAKIGDTEYATLAEAFASITTGTSATIELLSDCSGNGIVVPSGRDITVDFNNHTYTVNTDVLAGSNGTKTQCFQLLKDSKVTFNNGTIVADNAAIKMIIQNYSDLTLTGMTIDATTGTNSVNYVVSNNNGTSVFGTGTTITAKSTGVAFDVYSFKNTNNYTGAKVTVEGATINGNVEVGAGSGADVSNLSLALNSGTLNGNLVLGARGEEAVVTKSSDFVVEAPADYKWDADGKLVPKVYVAQIGDSKYETLSEAFASVTTNTATTIELLSDCSGNGIVVPSGRNITVNFNNHTYTVNTDVLAGSNGTKTQCFQLLKDSKVTFNNGTIVADNAAIKMIIQNYSDLTLTGMTIDATAGTNSVNYVVSNNNGTSVFGEGTTITAKSTGVAFDVYSFKNTNNYTGAKVTVEGATINGNVEVGAGSGADVSNLSLALNSGTLNGNLVLGARGEEAVVTKSSDFVAEAPADYKWDAAGKLVPKVYVAQIGDKKYETLTDAIADATDGQTVTLLADVTVDKTILIEKNLTIDGNENTIKSIVTSKLGTFYVNNKTCNLTIQNTKIDGQNSASMAVCVYRGKANDTLDGTSATDNDNAGNFVTLTNCTVENFTGYPGSYVGAVYAFSHSHLTLNNCTFTGNTTSQSTSGASGADVWTGAATTVVINGGTYNEVFVNTNSSNVETVTINGGAKIEELAICVSYKEDGSTNIPVLTIDNATVTNLTTEEGNPIPAEGITIQNGGSITNMPATEVAKILNGKKTKAFASLDDAIEIATDGQTITLLADAIATKELAANVTVDAASHALTLPTFKVADGTEISYAKVINTTEDTYRVTTATYSRTGAAGTQWGTVCLPFSFESAPTGYTLYTPSAVSAETLTVTGVEYPVAIGTPVIFFKNTTDEAVITSENASVKIGATPAEQSASLALVGTFSQQTITEGLSSIYFINGDKFHQAKVSLTVPAYRAYIKNTSAGAKAAVLNIVVDGEATAIEGVAADLNDTQAIYDVNGRQLSAPQKGINIMKLANGKTVKLIIK